MGLLRIARQVDEQYGELFDLYRGPVPRSRLSLWVGAECGGCRMAVSRDPVLIEVGLAQCPLVTAADLDVDPFDPVGGAWLACHCAARDLQRWQEVASGRDKLYLMLLSYSIGYGAARHVVALTEYYRGRGATLEGRANWIARSVDLSMPPHCNHWGRQSGRKVAERLRKQSMRLDLAAQLGPLECEAAPLPGHPPPGVQPCPVELEGPARICARRDATPEEHARAHEAVKAYAKARQRRERAPKADITWRIAEGVRHVAAVWTR